MSLEQVAAVVGWKHNVKDLLGDNWEAEETNYKGVSGDIV